MGREDLALTGVAPAAVWRAVTMGLGVWRARRRIGSEC